MASDKVEKAVEEPIERRLEPRGHIRGVSATLPGADRVPVYEGTPANLFVRIEDPDKYRLGGIHDIQIYRTIVGKEHCCRCQVEVVRKEIEPRRGLALRIKEISDSDAHTWEHILEPPP